MPTYLSRIDSSNIQARLARPDLNTARWTLADSIHCSIRILGELGDEFSVRVFGHGIERTMEFH